MKRCFAGSCWIGRKPENIQIDSKSILSSMRAQEEKINVQQGTVVLRKTFELSEAVEKATLQITGLGIYRAKINGKDIDDAVLKPITTDFRNIVLYDEREVSHLLRVGRNCITVEVGSGWYSSKKKYWDWRMYWMGNPKADVRMEITVSGGSQQVIVSDTSWKARDGAVTFCCIYDGESCDGRIRNIGWDNPQYDDSSWENAYSVSAPGGVLIHNMAPDIKVCDRNEPIAVYKLGENEFTYDFGKNCTGWTKVKVSARPGDWIKITHAEQMFEDYRINLESNRDALNMDTYIIGSEGEEIYEPGFTYHGFRYVQIKLSSPDIKLLSVKQCHVHSDIKSSGSFWCDNAEIQKIHDACVLTEKNALLGVSLDCTQRDERLGWLGDAWVTSQTCIYNFDMNAFYRRWLQDIQLAASEEGDIPFIVPQPQSHEGGSPDFSSGYLVFLWNHYRFYGEKDILQEHFDTVKKYVDYLLCKSEHFMLDKGRYGDWKSLVKGFKRGDPDYGNTLYLYMDIQILLKFAEVLNKVEIIEKYSELEREMCTILRKNFYNVQGKFFGSGEQFSNAFALLLGLIPYEDEYSVLDNLIGDIQRNGTHLTTGIFGTKFVMEVLRKYDRKDLIIQLLLQKEYPGWLDMLKNSTTLTETWDGNDMSRGHCMFGSVDSQMYMSLCGIEINHISENIITINPYICDEIKKLSGKMQTKYGEISVAWEQLENSIQLQVCVPNGVPSKIIIPKEYERVENGIWRKFF